MPDFDIHFMDHCGIFLIVSGIIADIAVADAADHDALIFESLFAALGHDHGVDLFQHGA